MTCSSGTPDRLQKLLASASPVPDSPPREFLRRTQHPGSGSESEVGAASTAAQECNHEPHSPASTLPVEASCGFRSPLLRRAGEVAASRMSEAQRRICVRLITSERSHCRTAGDVEVCTRVSSAPEISATCC